MKPITAGVILTRKCNLHCKYCAIPDRRANELSTEKWFEAIDIIASLGIKKINFIGGETTLYKGIREVIAHTLSSKIEYCSLITNGIKGLPVIKDLINIGLMNISFSLDTVDINRSISPIKAQAGMELLYAIEKENLNNKINMTAYCVINKTNIANIPELVKFLSEKKINTYFLPFHWDKANIFEHRKDDYGLSLSNNHELRELIERLVEMKKAGFLISNSSEFLRIIPNHIDKLDWRCTHLSELRVDADGKLMCCCDRQGTVHDKFTIFDLSDSIKMDKFLVEREKDALSCSGCLWPSSFEAELLNKERKYAN